MLKYSTLCWISRIRCSILWLDLIQSNSNNTEDQRIHKEKDCIEQQEDSQVVNNIDQHDDNWGEAFDDSQEKERFDEQKDDNQNHKKLCRNVKLP